MSISPRDRSFKASGLPPSVAELFKLWKMLSGPPKNLREEYVPLHFRIYGMDRMNREVVRVEVIDKLGAYVFDGPNKRYYHPLVIKNKVKRSQFQAKEDLSTRITEACNDVPPKHLRAFV
ncbi:hypothetical protein BCV72DRAFT_302784 [Rhizopus microsporus var. microsporus]|uniref:Uncharacterized protein n=2 Tax=Rhizopus microsporus TaxID=58291 RepID=A0A2G4T0H6_RHIZD|nr:uncharacterized protein RHIMIDRAFT_249476 [Rhizopus microsporus ATCC 52813]ORE09365.1 hypothetical protein BCV72DRAFT_302784 [Rhizopus microsporus var. microsporus]PHZ14519.1 hypothetical protein RHIMIDRAFT_249476 [Rhizopus microsporus ATCC 52813]